MNSTISTQIARPCCERKRGRAGFTLIEIIVVIAIVGVLAALVFPVLASARESGRRASCQNNLKQLGLALMQYCQDYRGKVPPVNSPSDSATPGISSWVGFLQPYVKSYQIMRCPSQKEDPYGTWSGAGNVLFQERWPSYGFNYHFLNPNNCQSTADGTDWVFTPLSLVRVRQPAETVAFAEAKIVGNDADGYYRSYRMAAPGTVGAGQCGYDDGGWGTGSARDDPAEGQNTSTGSFAPRHLGGGNVAFVDGHVKWMTPGRLAVGTNWAVGMANSDVQILDRSQYLWDTR